MNKQMSLSEMITYSTVLIRCEYVDGTSGSGTGFIINLCHNKETQQCVPVLITNNHVVDSSSSNSSYSYYDISEATSVKVKLNSKIYGSDTICEAKIVDQEVYSFVYEGNNWIHHPDSGVDLCCLLLGPAFNIMQKAGVNIFYIPLETSIIPTRSEIGQLSAMEDVVMIGYPIGLSDTFNHKPIIRKGITASHPKKNYKGKSEILVDMACFPGSSGSPVFILNQGTYTLPTGLAMGNRLMLLGVLYGGPQFSAQGILTFGNIPNVPSPVIDIPTNLGMIIKSEKVLEFESMFKE